MGDKTNGPCPYYKDCHGHTEEEQAFTLINALYPEQIYGQCVLGTIRCKKREIRNKYDTILSDRGEVR